MNTNTPTGGLKSSLPILDWLPHDKSEWFRFDMIAALSVWALLVPQGIAYSSIVGVISIALLLFFHRYLPTLPRTMIVAVIGILVADLTGLEKYGVSIVGPIPTGLPSFVWLTLPPASLTSIVLGSPRSRIHKNLSSSDRWNLRPDRWLLNS